MLRRLLTISFISLAFITQAFSEDVGAYIVMNAKNGKVLSQKVAYQKMSPASTTKIAIVSYVLSTPGLDLNQKVVVPEEAVRMVSNYEKTLDNFSKYPSYVLQRNSSVAGLKKGEILTIKDLLYANMLVSGNDAANTLAYYWGDGSIEKCMERVNRFVESLGCANTHFKNPHGLHHPEHLSSAYDLALLARYAMQNPTFRQLAKATSYKRAKTNKQPEIIWKQANKLVVSGNPYFYEPATGIKTGYHAFAQRCLVASAERGDRTLIAVVLRCPERKEQFSVPKKLFQQFLSEEKTSRTLIEEGPIQLKREIRGQNVPLELKATSGYSISFYPSEEPEIRTVVEWEDRGFPVTKDQHVGTVHIFADGDEVASVPLVSAQERKATWWQRLVEFQGFLKQHSGIFLSLGVIALFGMALFFRSNRS